MLHSFVSRLGLGLAISGTVLGCGSVRTSPKDTKTNANNEANPGVDGVATGTRRSFPSDAGHDYRDMGREAQPGESDRSTPSHGNPATTDDSSQSSSGPEAANGVNSAPVPSGSAAVTPALTNLDRHLVAGHYFTCVHLPGRDALCWGQNHKGQLGFPTEYPEVMFPGDAPGAVTGLNKPIRSLAASLGWHACALDVDGGAHCWGTGVGGNLGQGELADSNTAVPVLDLQKGVTQLVAGGFGGCALLEQGTVRCWGTNEAGLVGDGSNVPQSAPVLVVNLDQEVTQLAAGGRHNCALLEDQTLRCWGQNTYGQLGDGTQEDRSTPVKVLGLENVIHVQAGMNHTCAVTEDERLHCWGLGELGQLGYGGRENRSEPVPVMGLEGEGPISELSLGKYHSCVILASGEVRCWGDNYHEQVGTGDGGLYTTPMRPRLKENATAVALATGGFHTCVLLADETVSCWGDLILPEPGGENYREYTAPVPETIPDVP